MMRTIGLVSLLMAVGGCFNSSGNGGECDATRMCRVADSLGCCDGGGTEVSVCEPCPSGTVDSTMCRTAGCGPMCDDPVACRTDYGSGCCGDAVAALDCDTCPAGSVVATSCAMDFPFECGCDSSERPMPMPEPDPVPEPDPAPQPEPAPAPPISCHVNLGDGCCGEAVGPMNSSCCPMGTIPSYECGTFEGIRRIPTPCRIDLGGGCCGEMSSANACTGECPEGSILESACTALTGGPEPGGLVPLCVEIDPMGCCGEYVAPDACGQCPAGAGYEGDCMRCDG